ncbi:MAG: Hsp70 family protein, partial [Actinomycetales bacterium]|nr:Hsp70 family protein [Actinomycetales bacterium]
IPQIEVTFDIDANGIVHVSAKDRGTGKEQSMTISGGSALPKEEIERMVKDAEAHAEEDKKRREETETRNTAEQLVYSTEKFLSDSGDKVPADLRGTVDSALADLKEALKPESEASIEDIKAKMETLSTESQKMGSAIYAASQAEGGADAGAGFPGAEGGFPGGEPAGDAGAAADDVIDAEVVDDEETK